MSKPAIIPVPLDRESEARDRWLARFVSEQGDCAHRTAYRLLRDSDEASDAVQDALALVFQRWGELRSEESAKAWFFRILVNQCITRQRKRALRNRALELLGRNPEARSADMSIPSDFSEHVLPQLLTLPVKQRTTIILRYGDDRSVAEIAEAMGVSIDTTRTHLKRGLERLRKLVEAGKKESSR